MNCIYTLEYHFKDVSGSAVVIATNPKEAGTILASEGKFNGTPKVYNNITNITPVGDTDKSIGLISEVCKRGNEVKDIHPTINVTNISGVDINSLSKEDLERLKIRINKDTGTLYVNRIGDGSHRNRADVGFMYYDPQRNYESVFRFNGESFDELKIAFKFKYIESSIKRVDITRLIEYLRFGTNRSYSKFDWRKPEHIQYGLFMFDGTRTLGNTRDSYYTKPHKRTKWQFISYMGKGTYNIETRALHAFYNLIKDVDRRELEETEAHTSIYEYYSSNDRPRKFKYFCIAVFPISKRRRANASHHNRRDPTPVGPCVYFTKYKIMVTHK